MDGAEAMTRTDQEIASQILRGDLGFSDQVEELFSFLKDLNFTITTI